MIRETSISAYEATLQSGVLSKRRLEVYKALKVFGHTGATANEIFKVLSDGKNGAECAASNSAARFSELRDMGAIEEAGIRECSVTGMNVIVWRCTNNVPRRVSKKERLQKQIAQLEAKLVKLKETLELENKPETIQ